MVYYTRQDGTPVPLDNVKLEGFNNEKIRMSSLRLCI